MADGSGGSQAALAKAMEKGAGALGKGQQTGALAAAVGKIEGWQKRASAMKANAHEAGLEVVHTLETSGTAFGAAMAEGYWGRDKMRLGGFDMRIGVGLAGKAWSLYEALNGHGDGHIGALSQGVLDAGLVSLGIEAGQKLKESYDKKPDAAAPPPAAPPAPAPAPAATAPAIRGPLRELALSGPTRPAGRDRRFVDIPLDG